ncbi:S8 family serine peptidase [Bacillus shivajii]|uniref:S8 family serine peptidase n=1 Tax=Bacillus shivajii TaxID=1983719 RepID=UPI001CFBFDF5|nr:S8 family serine peptidase [Bacillus shivajii]UCZ52423.1 S8 family serine peptidase [Bacillus shivajii]
MKKIFSVLLILSLLVPFFITNSVNTEASLFDGVSVDPKLKEALTTNVSELEVIVTFEGDEAPTSENLKRLDDLGIDFGVTMQSLPIAGVIATPQQIEKLKQNDDILSLYSNSELEFYNESSTSLTGVDKVRTDDDMRKSNGGFPISGKGIGVVINDSGVDGTHEDHKFGENLVQNVLATTNLNAYSTLLPITYQEDVINTDTNSGHGTHVAGTVGGTGAKSGGKYEGVAPGANLIGYGSGGALFILDGIGGFDYAMTNQTKYDIRVVNNSWGSEGDFDPYHPINVATKKAYDRGIISVFAAGNSGPEENTHNPYAKAPWVISVAAGVKDGTLANFSSRGTDEKGGTFDMDGQEWTWEDRPAVTAPGVDVISTRVIAPLSALSATDDAEMIDSAHLPYYTTMSGTSMASPHVAGIIALMLEANPTLSPDEVKQILEETATNIPGKEPWEVGAGYVNAYAAVEAALHGTEYGQTLNMNQDFSSSADITKYEEPFSIDFSSIELLSESQYEFVVEEGISNLVARVEGKGFFDETGNPINLVLTAPDGTEYSSGINILFSIETARTVTVNAPLTGTWTAEIRGLRGEEINPLGIALPEEVEGTLTFSTLDVEEGLNDIEGHPAATAIKLGISERLFDGFEDGSFHPDEQLTRFDLAKYLVMGAGIRQTNTIELNDVDGEQSVFAKAVSAKGAAIRDIKQQQKPVMLMNEVGYFNPDETVTREELAYSLVQSLGLQELAREHEGDLTVQYKDERIHLEDMNEISSNYKGYVQVALDLNILNAYFDTSQGRFDLSPTVTASFNPNEMVKRGEFAVAMTRYYQTFLK